MTYASHDLMLRHLRDYAPELRNRDPQLPNGAPNHAPMVIEALAALGRGDFAPEWIAAYQERLMEGPSTDAHLGGMWHIALGDYSLLGEWQNLFRSELEQLSWKEVLDRWLPRLVPGIMAAGTHGIIRCGHAVRALRNEQTPLRLEELAHALAYCAARYRTLASRPNLCGECNLESAVGMLPKAGPEIDRRDLPPRVANKLSKRSDFARAVQQLAPPTDVTAALSELAEIGARLYLRGAKDHPLILLHAITGPAAVQLIVPVVSCEVAGLLFAHIWQAVAAWIVAFGDGLAAPMRQKTDMERSWTELIGVAVDSWDEHAIKLTEACHRQEGMFTSRAFRAVASDWTQRVMESRSWSPTQRLQAGIEVRLS